MASFFSHQNQRELDKTVDGNSIFWDWKGESEQNIEENDPNEIIVHKMETEVGVDAGELNLIQDGNSILVTWSGPELEKIVDGNSIHWSWTGVQQVRIILLLAIIIFSLVGKSCILFYRLSKNPKQITYYKHISFIQSI